MSFKRGDRIELVSMPNDPNPLPAGTRGTVEDSHHVGMLGFTQVSVAWDNGSRLMLSIPPDRARKVDEEQES